MQDPKSKVGALDQAEIDALTKPKFRPNVKAKAAIAEMVVQNGKRPNLVITGRSTMTGHRASLIRIRRSIWRDLEKLETVGTRQYLVVEAALRMFIGHLQGLATGETMILDAEKMTATEEDFQLLRDTGREVTPVPRKRTAKRSLTDFEDNLRPLSK